MNVKIHQPTLFNLRKTVRRDTIRETLRNKNSTFRFLYSLISPLIRDSAYFTYAYCYMRHIDDLIDDPKTSASEAVEILNEQVVKIRMGYDQKEFHPNDEYELMLGELIHYDIKNGSTLKRALFDMIDSLYFDAHRVDRVLSRIELEEYSRSMGESFMKFLSHFLHPETGYSKEVTDIAGAACQIYMLRDLKEDLERGYFNIDSESVEKYSIDFTNIDSDGVRNWIEKRVYELEAKIKLDSALHKNPISFREKLVLLLFLEPRKYVLKKLSRNKFNVIYPYKLGLRDYLELAATLLYQLVRPSHA